MTFTCRLPISQQDPSVANHGAFITFPSETITVDPASAFEQPVANRPFRSIAQPYLSGSPQPLTFTRRYGRWLPAGLPAVSPDSSHYAYGEEIDSPTRHYRIHSVEVRSGLDRVVYDRDFYVVLDYESEGIYLAGTGGTGEGQAGLWLLDPTSGALRQIAPPSAAAAPYGFYLIGVGAAWYGDLAPGDQPPHLGIGPMDRLIRFDLKSKVATPWFRRAGMQVQAIGFDGQGHPVVSAEAMSQDGSRASSQELWIVRGPSAAQRIYTGPSSTVSDIANFSSVLADDHGLWLGSDRGVFLYTADGQFRRTWTPAADVAGRCS